MALDVADVLDVLESAIDRLVRTDAFSYADRGSLVRVQRLRARLEYAVDKAMAEFAASGEWALDGAKDAVPWVSTRCHLPVAEARGQIRRGQALETLPLCAEAFSEGEIGAAQVDVLARAASGVDAAFFAHDEMLLVEMAQGLKFGAFNAAMAYWSQYANPAGAEEAELARQASRRASVVSKVDGMVQVNGLLAAIPGTIVADELRRLCDEMFEADWAKAKEELGREPKVSELWRTGAQRWADTLVEMAIRSQSAPADGRRPEPLFSVLVDYPTLSGRVCQLEGGQVVTPGSLDPWMDEATFERIVFAPGQRAEVSVTSRFFTGATRRAVEVRDLQCTHEFCELPAERCQIDHIIPYSNDGETTQENAQVLCGFHNRLRNNEPKTKAEPKSTQRGSSPPSANGGRHEVGEHGPEPGG
jgi:hypothetical protein